MLGCVRLGEGEVVYSSKNSESETGGDLPETEPN